MRRYAAAAGWIALVWIALWGDLSWANVVGGVLVAGLVLAAVPLPVPVVSHRITLGPALHYFVLFLRDLCVATFEVARQVFWPIARLRPGVVAVPLRSHDAGLLALVANTITLTPGTMTIEVDPAGARLWVHVLHLVPYGERAVVEQAQALERLGARALGVELPTGPPSPPAPPAPSAPSSPEGTR